MTAAGARSVLVTGCSSGIGLETVLRLARHGWRVFAGLRDPTRGEALRQALAGESLVERVTIIPLDVTADETVRRAVAELSQQTRGTLDAVVHNAGVAAVGFFEEIPDADCRRVMETNFFGVLRLTRETLPVMRAQGHGRIVIVSSNSAYTGTPAGSVYGASKWAIEGWAESVALELQPFGIVVSLVEPGSHRSNMFVNTQWFTDEAGPYRRLVPSIRAKYEQELSNPPRGPERVAARIAKNLEARRPSFRTLVGADARWSQLSRHFMTYRLRSRILGRMVGLAGVEP